jgi:hypothetical protein
LAIEYAPGRQLILGYNGHSAVQFAFRSLLNASEGRPPPRRECIHDVLGAFSFFDKHTFSRILSGAITVGEKASNIQKE